VKSLRPTHHETFNVLKTQGYNLEHNFGHGKQTLANLLVTLRWTPVLRQVAMRESCSYKRLRNRSSQ
jgi:hypothetical protein